LAGVAFFEESILAIVAASMPGITLLSGLLQGGLYSGLLYLAWQTGRSGRRAGAMIPLAAVLLWAGLGAATLAGVDLTAALEEPPETFRASSAPLPQPYRTAFEPTEYRPYATRGSASVLGQAPVDEQWDGRGAKVVVKPLTSLSREWWARTIQRGEQELYSPSSWEDYDRSALADNSGRFRFDSLPVGGYFLAAHLVSRRRQLDDTLRWAWFGDSLTLQGGEPLTILLPKVR
jgi:hypothetical protein